MIESSSWTSSSRDEEIHKMAGNVQLRKYSQFFSQLSSSWSEPSSSLSHIFEGPIRLVYRSKEPENLLSLVETDNKNLSKILAAVAATCREIRILKTEFYDFYSKLFAHGERNFEENDNQPMYAQLFSDLQSLSVYSNRVNTVIHLTVRQISSITNSSSEMYLPALLEHLIDAFIILLMIDEVLDANPGVQEQFKQFRIQIRSVMHNPEKFSVPELQLMTFDKLLKDINHQLLMKNIFHRGIENVMELPKTPIMNEHLITYLKNILTEIETKISEPSIINKNWIRVTIGTIVAAKLFGVCDKRIAKKLSEINKKLYAVTLIGNVIFIPSILLSEYLPREFGSPLIPQVGEKLLGIRLQRLGTVSANLIQRSMNWCIESMNLLSGTDFQIGEIKKQYFHLKDFIHLMMEIQEQVAFLTNLHATLGKPMTRGTVQIVCRLIEVQKNLETTLHGMGCAVVQAQARGLQYLSYQILTILKSAKKGLVQKDHAYSKEGLDSLSMMNLSIKLINGNGTPDRRLLARCALSISRQLSDTFREEELTKLKRKLSDYDTIADFYTILSEICDYSVLLHHQSMLPAYFSSISDSDQDVSHMVHLLNAFNTAIIKHGPSIFTKIRTKALKESLIKNILEPGCREIETSLRLHVHAHLKLDSSNPFKIGSKNSGRIVRSSPLPIANELISPKRFVEHYLDDIFYNLTTVALHDWKTYRTMHALAKHKLGLETVRNHLPTQTIEQGLDALEIMRNINVFVSKYLYNLNTQTFIEHTSSHKHLNTIGIRHIANSIRTHGTGIMSTTVNFVYQYLKAKLHTFSQFLFDEHIKSRLLRDVRFIRAQREKESTPYTYERAEKFQKGIRKLGMTQDGLSYLDQFRQLITQIGNALGYVRLIRSGGLHASANAISFLPEINSTAAFEETCKNLNYSETSQQAAKRLDDDIENLVRNFTEGIQYFKLLVNVFSSAFRDVKSHHLQQFYAIIPPLTLSFIDNAISNKEKIFKKNKDGAAFTDDGFAMGIAYINALLDQSNELDGIQWFETVNEHLREEKRLAETKTEGEDEKLEQTRALTLKRLAERTAEFDLLYYSLSGARVFFKQGDL